MVLNDDTRLLEKNNIIVSTVDKLLNWGRAHSFWPLTYGCNCCPIEMIAAGGSRFDISRFGYEVFRASPRQADLLIVAGPVTLKMKPVLERVYAQMPEPKWVLAMGNCATAGGPYRDAYSVIPGCDNLFNVDVYLPGCPPRPEALFHALLELKKRVEKGNRDES